MLLGNENLNSRVPSRACDSQMVHAPKVSAGPSHPRAGPHSDIASEVAFVEGGRALLTASYDGTLLA